jgi:hypothetical protein
VISGRMFYHKEPKKSLADIIKFLTKLHRLENVKYVLVHPDQLSKKQMVDNTEIKPNKSVLPNHFWFISENNIEKRPKFKKFEK